LANKATEQERAAEPARSSEEELADAAGFDEAVNSLPGILEELRPRRLISRIGRLLRAARDHNDLGQAEISKLAHVTQPYLSRLENGLLPKRGPTVEVLLRCIEAAGCELEISVRSKKDGALIGHLTSADLNSADWSPGESVTIGSHDSQREFPPMLERPWSRGDEVNVVFAPGPRKTKSRTVWLGTGDRSRAHKWTHREQQILERFAKSLMRTRKGQKAPIVKTVDTSSAKSNTVKAHEGDLVVLASDLTSALGLPEGTRS
jgi:transcriptional regulator with XRE-family HTH domain